MNANNVHVKVRLQARGGKFLGPNVTTPELVVQLTNGATLFSGNFNNAASGTVIATPASGSSRNAIVVQPPPSAEDYPAAGAYSLQPPGNDAMIVASFYLNAPAAIEFIATAYTKIPQAGLKTSTTMQLFPGASLVDDPGLLLTIPGLIVSGVTATYTGGVLTIGATVTMMCGCPITPQPWSSTPPNTEPYWPSYEFRVSAEVPGLPPIALQCTSTNTFSASTRVALTKGTYIFTVVALQPAETNSGYAIGQFTVSA